MLVSDQAFHDAKAKRHGHAMALAGQLAPANFSPAGLNWLVRCIEEMPLRGTSHTTLTDAQVLLFISQEIPESAVVEVEIVRRSARRGRLTITATLDLARASCLRRYHRPYLSERRGVYLATLAAE